jgi:hypothetical protein
MPKKKSNAGRPRNKKWNMCENFFCSHNYIEEK